MLTDIGGDPDDQQSMVRLLHYANEFKIEGIVASAHNNSPTNLLLLRDDLVHELIDQYAQCKPNFDIHAKGYPEATTLHKVVKRGSNKGGRNVPLEKFVGQGFDTEGSDWIISVVDRLKDSPINISVWGGACDLAQALWKVRHTRSKEKTDLFVSHLRVFFIGKQDSSNEWIINEFPKLWLILALDPGGDKWASGYRGMFWGGDMSSTTKEWIHQHIYRNPLGRLYPDKTYTGGKGRNPYNAMKEGDSPSMLYFLDNGINIPSHPEWGGWGGRYIRERNDFFREAADCWYDPFDRETICSARAAVFRWRDDFQNDFAARVIWGSTGNYKKANHAPQIVVNNHGGEEPLYMKVKAGQWVTLDASESTDPDGNDLTVDWFFYPEAGTYTGELPRFDSKDLRIRFELPVEATNSSVHLICRLKDNGTPSLVAYRRIILEIE